jgi:hypothetical protein
MHSLLRLLTKVYLLCAMLVFAIFYPCSRVWTQTHTHTHTHTHISIMWHLDHVTSRSRDISITWHLGHVTSRSRDISITWHLDHVTSQSRDISITWHLNHVTSRSRDTSITWHLDHAARPSCCTCSRECRSGSTPPRLGHAKRCQTHGTCMPTHMHTRQCVDTYVNKQMCCHVCMHATILTNGQCAGMHSILASVCLRKLVHIYIRSLYHTYMQKLHYYSTERIFTCIHTCAYHVTHTLKSLLLFHRINIHLHTYLTHLKKITPTPQCGTNMHTCMHTCLRYKYEYMLRIRVCIHA